jgi:serine protease AprX
MAIDSQVTDGTRASALWGTGGKRGDSSRTRATWRGAGRTAAGALVVAALMALLVPLGAAAGDNGGSSTSTLPGFFIPANLLAQANASPASTFAVIVQGNGSTDAAKLARHISIDAVHAVRKTDADAQSAKILKQEIRDQFSSIDGVSATLTGDQITTLVARGSDGLLSITPDAPVQTTGSTSPFSSTQVWPYEANVSGLWASDGTPSFASAVPTIAIVDSGIQSRSDFGSRLLTSVDLSSLPNNSPGDGRGHGTFVAGIAADGLPGITGTNPAANLVDLDVMDDTGMGLTSDVIRACQWILDNKSTYNIRVANFSLHSSITAPFFVDPLDRAVEQLWFNGVTVVVASGNYGSADGPSGVLYSPGDDPFVITVGAADVNGSTNPMKADVAPWSAWGSTIDGFGKPELSAPGRYMIGPVPPTATLALERPANVTSPGYIQLSGTSFAAPVVAGAAADILAAHPSFTPDQVKGALMASAKGLGKVGGAGGVGVVQVKQAVALSNPPNPNLALDAFVAKGSSSGATSFGFDATSWTNTAKSNASWNSVSWNSASWNSASWNSASWNSVSWNSASWNSASWNSASWNSSAAADASREDAAEGDSTGDAAETALGPDDVAALLADPSFDPSSLPPWLLHPAAAGTATATQPAGPASP